jgi:hypothetical protein
MPNLKFMMSNIDITSAVSLCLARGPDLEIAVFDQIGSSRSCDEARADQHSTQRFAPKDSPGKN